MAKVWLEERLSVLLPALSALGTAQEAEIARLCEEEIAAWRARPTMKKASALRPVMTAARNAIKQLPLTQENRYKDVRSGQWQHIALKYMNFTDEEWAAMNAISDEKFQARLENQQVIDHPQEVVQRAEKFLHSDRWDDMVTGLAVVTGRRLTEILKTGRFFPKTMYTVIFDGQLKRKDIALEPYEIPVLVNAELVLAAWRKLRSLEDTTAWTMSRLRRSTAARPVKTPFGNLPASFRSDRQERTCTPMRFERSMHGSPCLCSARSPSTSSCSLMPSWASTRRKTRRSNATLPPPHTTLIIESATARAT